MTLFQALDYILASLFTIGALERIYFLKSKCALNRKEMRTPADSSRRVAIQLPMYNEREVFRRIIQAAVEIDWPPQSKLIQILDDSTDADLMSAIDDIAYDLRNRGHFIQVIRRPDRNGFKAGSLQRALSELINIEYVAIFDADFVPTKDFLKRCIGILDNDKSLAFVQARWTYTNSDYSTLTRLQEVSLNYHFGCEQRSRSVLGRFLNFNGSAGVWRVKVIQAAGGWNGESLVEDADLSVRAYLLGAHGVFLDNLLCPNEIPPTLKGYRSQQRRWLAGPMHLACSIFPEILRAQLSLKGKIDLVWFFARYLYFPLSAIYWIVLLPILLYSQVPCIVSFACAFLFAAAPFFETPKHSYLVLPYALGWDFSYFKARSVVEGLLGTEGARIWTVTERAQGNSSQGTISKHIFGEELAISCTFLILVFLPAAKDIVLFRVYCALCCAIYFITATSLIARPFQLGSPECIQRER